MKGTCFFIIGLISSTQMGAEILEEYGWIATRTPMGQTTGLCLPNNISRFAYIEPWNRQTVNNEVPPMPVLTGLEGEVMHMISNLSNYVIAAGAMNNLKRVRNRHPRLFSSTTFFHRAMRTISTNHFPPPVRRFILELFDIELGPHTLPRLTHLERGSYSLGPPHPDPIEDEDPPANGLARDDGEEANRRRAKSSPGPEPPARPKRGRGLTVGEPPFPDIFSPIPPVPPMPVLPRRSTDDAGGTTPTDDTEGGRTLLAPMPQQAVSPASASDTLPTGNWVAPTQADEPDDDAPEMNESTATISVPKELLDTAEQK
jgi:hypothetical protein